MTRTYDMPMDTPPTPPYDIENPFKELNLAAGWWMLRPRDIGDGLGYQGLALFAKRFNGRLIEQREFHGGFAEVIEQATEWCAETKKAEPTKTKRVIPRS